MNKISVKSATEALEGGLEHRMRLEFACLLVISLFTNEGRVSSCLF